MTKHFEKFDMSEQGGDEGKLAYNFSAGPCILPRQVLDKAGEGLINYRGCNQSVMELSHRKPEFVEITYWAKEELRRFLNVPKDYRILLNQGGATLQYTAIVKNLIGLKPQKKAMYLTTGLWSNQCIQEARRHIPSANLIEVANSSSTSFTQLPDPKTWKIDPEASYFHLCVNETVNGFEIGEENFPWHLIPKDMVVIGDMSSNIGTRPINWDRYDVVYAGAQKNLGPSGCAITIVKESLLGKKQSDTPIMCDWEAFEKAPGGYYNTPPCWPIYVTALNISYMNQRGGTKHYDTLAEQRS